MKLIVNDCLVKVISLLPQSLDFSGWPTFGLCCVMGTDRVESLLQ